jgi:hypothetical protein
MSSTISGACLPCCGGAGDSCCGHVAPKLCAYLSSSDGCNVCMNAKVIEILSGGVGSGSWSGGITTDCGGVNVLVKCRTCCPSLGEPGTMTALFTAETAGGLGPCTCLDGFSITLNWDELRQGMYGQGLSPCGDTVAVFLDFSQPSCTFQISSDRYPIVSLGTQLDSCSPFQLHQHCQQVSATSTAFKVTITGGGEAGTGTGGSCKGYYLQLTCGGETKTVFPDNCSCSPFSLSFPPITLTSCCGGTVTVTVLDICPESANCSKPGLVCCCDELPTNWVTQAISGYVGPDSAFLNGTFTLAPHAEIAPCFWSNGSAFQIGWELVYDPPTTTWSFAGLHHIGSAGAWVTGTLPASQFDCMGPNTFPMTYGGGASGPAFLTVKPQ